jgi:UDP-2-acetamido-2,6-beta-L-arabino-hexul-4-ose reductase
MLKIGITGQSGFIGSYLYNTIRLSPEKYKLIEFEKYFFEEASLLDSFVNECDIIVHLAAMNRHSDATVIYETNLRLVELLVQSLSRTDSSAHVLMSSSTQEEQDNLYGQSKKEGRKLFEDWSHNSDGSFTGLIIPNVFGPFGKPDYNSVVATFCHKLTHDEDPQIHQDGQLKLIYVGELVEEIIDLIKSPVKNNITRINPTSKVKVSEMLAMLNRYKSDYYQKGIIPPLDGTFELNLFNTFRSYIDPITHFPVKFNQHRDARGAFVEIIRLNVGGQVSFSTTVPGITRGNHFHTRKIERFSVIKGKARIQLRKVGTSEVLDFELAGSEAAYVDMPIWFTHNITNMGNEDLYTIFWINEFYNPEDADTYFEEV